MKTEVLNDLQSMHRIFDAWEDLFHSSTHRHLSAAPDFVLNWIDHFGKTTRYIPYHRPVEEEEHSATQCLLFLSWDGDRLDAALPMRLVPQQHLFMTNRYLVELINSHSTTSNLLIRQGKEHVLESLFRAVRDYSEWDVFGLGAIPTNASVLNDTVEACRKSGLKWIRAKKELNSKLTLSGTFEQYLAGRASLRKRVFYSRRYLEKTFGPLSVECLSGLEALDPGFQLFVDIDALSWKRDRGEALAVFPRIRDYYVGLVSRFAERGRCEIWILRINGNAAAAMLCFAVGGVLYTYKTSFDQRYAINNSCRPGFVLDTYVLERSWERYEAIDFCSDWVYETWKCDVESLESHVFVADRFCSRFQVYAAKLAQRTRVGRYVLRKARTGSVLQMFMNP